MSSALAQVKPTHWYDLDVPDDRLMTPDEFSDAMQQIGRFWGTLHASRAYSKGESVTARNVGLTLLAVTALALPAASRAVARATPASLHHAPGRRTHVEL